MSARMVVALSKVTKARPLRYVQIHCRVKPGVTKNREGVSCITEDAVELNVAAPPREGEANKAVVRVMSEVIVFCFRYGPPGLYSDQALKIPKSEVSIISGLKSRDKTVEVSCAALGLAGEQQMDDWQDSVKDRLVKGIAASA